MTIYEPGTRYHPGGWLPEQPGENIAETVTDNGDGTGTRTVYGEAGAVVSTEDCQVPAAAIDSRTDALAAVQTARQEVAGYAKTNGTRRAVEALATVAEALIRGV